MGSGWPLNQSEDAAVALLCILRSEEDKLKQNQPMERPGGIFEENSERRRLVFCGIGDLIQ
jgi:hypothetical protein